MKFRYSALLLLLFALPARGKDLPSIVDIAQLYSDGEFEKCMEAASKRVEADSTDDVAIYYLAQSSFSQGDADTADSLITKALALYPDNTAYLELALDASYYMQDSFKAASICNKLITLVPNKYQTAPILTLLGNAELVARNDKKAGEYYTKALLLDEHYSPALIGLADVNRIQGNFPAFFRLNSQYARDPEMSPRPKCDYFSNFLNMVDGRFFKSWHTQIDGLVQDCLETHPGDSTCIQMAGVWYYRTGRQEQGKEYMQELFDRFPKAFSTRCLLLDITLLEEDYPKVIDICNQMLKECDLTADQSAWLYSTIGSSSFEMGNNRKACRSFEKAIKLAPSDPMLLNNYAYGLVERDLNIKKAEAMARTSLELEPDNVNALDTYGWILYKLKRYKEAKQCFKNAIIHGGKDNKVVLEHYSIVLDALGEKDLSDYYSRLANKAKDQ